MAKKKKYNIIGWVDEEGTARDEMPDYTSRVQPIQNTMQSVQNTVQAMNSVKPVINQPIVTNNTITDTQGNVTVTKPIEKSNTPEKKNKTVKDYKKERDTAYEKLEKYKKEKGINFLNSDSKKNKNDKEYQALLKETQNKQKEYDNARQNKNVEKVEKELEKNKNIGGTIAKLGIGAASGVTRGIGGLESTARKLTGQVNEDERQKYEIFDPMLSSAYKTASKPEQVAMGITQSWGQMAPQALVGNPVGATTLGFANYGGSAYNDAKKEGATEEQATTYGIASGGTEMFMEKLLGGFENIYGKKMAPDFTQNVMSKLIKNKAVRDTLSGMKGEFTEEYLQEFLEPILKNIILKEDNGADFWNTMKDDIGLGLKQLGSQFFNQQNLQAGLMGGLSSGLLQGPMNFAINQQAKQNGMTYEQYQNILQQPLQTPNEVISGTPIQGVQQENIQTPYQVQTPQITPLNEVNQELQETRQNDIANQVQAMNLEKTPEFTQKQGNYVYEKSDNAKIDTLRKDAATYLKEGEQTTNFVNTLEKLVQDKDVEIRFDPKLGKNVNGTYKDGIITINPNSNRAGEFVAIHELTHAIGTDSMIKMIDNYRKSNAEFNQAVEKLLGTYNANEINEEALGDIAGQLFGNQEFINNLSVKDNSVFSKLYREIKYLWHQFRGYKNQNEFIDDLYHKWDQAYRQQKIKQNQNAKYSLVGIEGIKEAAKTDEKYNKILNDYNIALDIRKNGINSKKISNEEIRQLTGWFQDKYKDWKYEVTDDNEHAYLKGIATKNQEFNSLSDYFEHDLLYKIYPELKDVKVKFTDMKSSGKYNSKENTIYINNDYTNSYTDQIGTLLHELQHIIQHKEGFVPGASASKGILRYLRRLGEIEAADTKLRREMTSEERKAIAPETSKKNPKHPHRKEILEDNKLAKIGEPFYNTFNDVLEKGALLADEIIEKKNRKNNKKISEESEEVGRFGRSNDKEELGNSSFSYDNTGRELSKQQQEYFKDSKARDENGNLIELYHGTPNEFTKFNYDKLGTNGTLLGKGFYLTDDINVGEAYANKSDNGKIMKLYADIQKPLKWGEKSISKSQYKDFVEAINEETNGTLFADYSGEYSEKGSNQYNSTLNDILMDYEYGGDDIDLISGLLNSTGMSWEKAYRILKDVTGYDGIIVTKDVYDSGEGNVYIPFLPEQIKNVDNLNPTKVTDIRYSKDNKTWREYLEKEFPNQGTRTDLGEVTGRKQKETTKPTTQEKTTQEQPKKVVKQEYLTKAEQEELEELKQIDDMGIAEENEIARLKELTKKSQGITKKYPDLKTENTFEDIKGIYGKYKNNEISTENNKILKQAKNFIEANKQGRRTKDQWLQIAEFIGSNADIKSSQDLQKLAMETWFETKPNNSSALNRQGQKYVKFTPQDWVNAIYKGAGVGTETKLSQEEKTTINEAREDNVIKVTPNTAVKNFNSAKKGDMDNKKMRSWVDTSNVATGKTDTISQANIDAITYEVKSNKETYEKAVKNTQNLTYGQKVFRAADKLNSNKKLTPVDLAEAQLALREAATKGDTKTYLNLQQDIAIMGTELGQMVQSLSMIQKLSPDGQLMMLNKIINRQQKLGNKNWDGVELDENLVKKVLDSYDDETHTTFNKEKLDQAVDNLKQNLADQMKIGTDEKINEWRYLSMLGNPKTHIRNIVANVAMTVTKRTKETLNAGLQDLIIRDPSKKTATLKKSSQEVKDLSEIAYNETFEVNKGNKYNEKNEIESRRQVFNNKIIENFRKLNAKALDLEDQAFKKIEFERAFSNFLTAQNIKTVQDINTHPEIVEQAKAFALEESKIATFQQENEFANWINKLDRKGPIAKVVRGAIIPFTRTPLNIAKTGIEYAPGTGLLTTIADIKKAPDNMKGNVAINGISKQITGTSLALLGYALAKSGLLQSGDDDDKEGKFKKDQGMSMGFSIKLGNKFYDLSWLSPSSMPLFVGASMYEQLEKSDGINGNVVMEGIANTLDPLSEMSCISSFTNVLKSFQSGSSQMISSMAQKTAQNYISQFVPTVSSQFARVFDTKKRTTDAGKDSTFTFGTQTMKQLMYKIPGLRNQLPEQTDIFGKSKKEEENIITRAVEAFLSPANTRKEAAGKEAKEILKVYEKTGDTDIIPSSLQKTIKYQGEDVKLSNREWNSYKKDFGTTFKTNMDELMNSKEYKKASNEEKSTMISGLMKYSKDKAKDNYLESKDMPYSYISDKIDEFVGDDYSIADYYIMKTQAPELFKYGTTETKRKKIDTARDMDLDLQTYYKIQKEMNDIQGDVNSNGKTVSGSKKRNVIDYINSLDYLTEEQKNQLISSKYKKW